MTGEVRSWALYGSKQGRSGSNSASKSECLRMRKERDRNPLVQGLCIVVLIPRALRSPRGVLNKEGTLFDLIFNDHYVEDRGSMGVGKVEAGRQVRRVLPLSRGDNRGLG